MKLVEKLRKQYPSPTTVEGRRWRSAADRQDCYCVGGALCLHITGFTPFPSAVRLADVLRIESAEMLSETRAMTLANQIIALNDIEEFEASWQLLEVALSYGETDSDPEKG